MSASAVPAPTEAPAAAAAAAAAAEFSFTNTTAPSSVGVQSAALDTPPDAAAGWFFASPDISLKGGPVPASAIRDLLRVGALSSASMLWQQGMPEWVPVTDAPASLQLAGGHSNESSPALKASEESASENIPVASSDASDERVWFFVSPQEGRVGPLSQAALLKLYDFAQISDVTQCWKAGMPSWTRLSSIDSLNLAIAEAAAVDQQIVKPDTATPVAKKNPKRGKKRKRQRLPTCVYITGLPPDVSEDELVTHCKRAGILQRTDDGSPRIKLYRRKEDNIPKGDASVWYARPESVSLALTLLDNDPLRPAEVSSKHQGWPLAVQVAVFKQNANLSREELERRKLERKIREERRKDPKLKNVIAFKRDTSRALGWGEDDAQLKPAHGKGLRVVILLHMFTQDEVEQHIRQCSHVDEDTARQGFFEELRKEVGLECERKCGPIAKITIFEYNELGAISIKFKQTIAAEKCIELMNGRFFAERRVSADWWDGITDYKRESEESMKKRHDAYGRWLDSQNIPTTDEPTKGK